MEDWDEDVSENVTVSSSAASGHGWLPQFGNKILGIGRASIRGNVEQEKEFGSHGGVDRGFDRRIQNSGGGRSGFGKINHVNDENGFGNRNGGKSGSRHFENEDNNSGRERGFGKGLNTDGGRSSNRGFGSHNSNSGFSKYDTEDIDSSDTGNSGFGGGRGRGFGSRGGRGRGGGNQGGKPGDWVCRDENCGNSNFAFRKNCQKCDTPKPDDDGSDGGFSRMKSGNDGFKSGGFGKGGRDENQKGEWLCPDTDCGNKNFAFRKVCQKCNTPKPEDSAGGGLSEKPREAPYIPPTPSEKEEDIFSGTVQKGINFDKYDDIPVEVSGRDQCGFISTFDEAGLFPTFIRNVKRAKYERPTPIQKYAIPIITGGRDLMACAQTGSGKTAAFILPVLTAMIKSGLTTDQHQEVQLPQTICVAPTRELALQIYNDCRKFAFETDIRAVVLYGGTSLGYQMRQVENGAHFVIGTPGRLLDVIARGKISLSQVQFLILDEADRMLDMGFEPEIRKLVQTMGMPPKTERQTLMFSATFPEEIQKLAGDFLNDYLFVTVGRVGGANTDVSQNFFEVDRLQKREALCDILNAGGSERTLVFVEMKRNADFLASFLCQSGFPTTSIHGDRLQREREEALVDFKSGKSYVLVATSVAARGLDIPGVMHVINYDLPSSIDEYVHRIGRTGRCGNLGKATSFFNADTDLPMAAPLVRILKEARQQVPEWLAAHASGMAAGDAGSFSGKFGGKDIRSEKYGGGGGNSGNDINADNYAAGFGAQECDEDWG